MHKLMMAVKCKQLTTANRKAACCMVLAMSDEGVPARGAFSVATSFFNVSRQTISAEKSSIQHSEIGTRQ